MAGQVRLESFHLTFSSSDTKVWAKMTHYMTSILNYPRGSLMLSCCRNMII